MLLLFDNYKKKKKEKESLEVIAKEEEFNDKVERILTSLEKINRLMTDFKKETEQYEE